MRSRRQVLEAAASAVLFAALARSDAFARGTPAELDAWAREMVGLNVALRDGTIGMAEWQAGIEALNGGVDVAALISYLDIDALTRGFTYASRLADIADPVLPPAIAGRRRQWFIRVFGMRRDGAVIPHVHNGMVSAHLVISGAFHVRTADRVADADDAVLLRPTRDEVMGVGGIISMSDIRDNHHWLVAETDGSMTFDVGVVDVTPERARRLEANAYSMIFVDADRRPERDGSILAPVMSFDACRAKYAG